MNRDELAGLVFKILHSNQWTLHHHEFSSTCDELVDTLWPVLAQVWLEGYSACYGTDTTTDFNPYGEVPDAG